MRVVGCFIQCPYCDTVLRVPPPAVIKASHIVRDQVQQDEIYFAVKDVWADSHHDEAPRGTRVAA